MIDIKQEVMVSDMFELFEDKRNISQLRSNTVYLSIWNLS